MRSTKVTSFVKALGVLYAEHGKPGDAQAMKKYLRGQFAHFGLKSPLRSALDKEFLASYTVSRPQRKRKRSGDSMTEEQADDSKETLVPSSIFTEAQLTELVQNLWDKEEREFQYFAMGYLVKPISHVSVTFIDTLQHMVEHKSWWDTVDMLASKHVGTLVQRFPDQLTPVMEKWINDENMWLRRTALLFQLSYKETTDEERLFRFCRLRMQDTDFFMRKAIGWALRQHARHRMDAVRDFVVNNQGALSALSIREAMKHIHTPKGLRERMLAAKKRGGVNDHEGAGGVNDHEDAKGKADPEREDGGEDDAEEEENEEAKPRRKSQRLKRSKQHS